MKLRLLLDTNVVVSGLLWGGHSRQLLQRAIDGSVALYCSPVLIDELGQTLRYDKLQRRIASLQTTAQALVLGGSYQGVRIVTPAEATALLQALQS